MVMLNANVKVPEVQPTVPKPLTAKVLSSALADDSKERIEGEKSLTIHMTYGKRPEVVFHGFWNGKFIAGAMNAVAKAYRLQRAKPKPAITNQKVGGSNEQRA
jgi:hypothetical protein